MSEIITGEFIKSAMAKTIKEKCDNPTIYKEKQLQGMQTPCFFVLEIKTNQDKKFMGKYERIYSMIIHYMPDDKSKRKYENCAEIGNLLSEYLEFINTGSTFSKGTNIYYEIKDEVLHFYIKYVVRMLKETPSEEELQTLKINENLKEEL